MPSVQTDYAPVNIIVYPLGVYWLGAAGALPVDGKTRPDSEADITYAGNAVARFLGQMAAHNRADMKKLIRLAEGN